MLMLMVKHYLVLTDARDTTVSQGNTYIARLLLGKGTRMNEEVGERVGIFGEDKIRLLFADVESNIASTMA
jgi:hypothetical protein